MFFINLLIATLTIVAPIEDATVSLLRDGQLAYLSLSKNDRFKRLDDAKFRSSIVREGCVQRPVKLEWKGAAGPYQLEVDFAEGGNRQVFTITNSTCAYITNLELGRGYRWRVSVLGEEAGGRFFTDSTPPRLMRIDGVVNVRDLGGWKGLNGKKIRQNMIFRSAGFRGSAVKKDKSIFANRYEDGGFNITTAGLEYVRQELSIHTEIELRGQQETVFMNSSLIGNDVVWMKEPFSAYDFIDNMVRGREPFVKVFRRFVERKNYPIMFHCSGGRDRTGTLAFLLLGLLGVSEDDACRDWEASIFAEENLEFGSSRITRLCGYLNSLGGKSLVERCENYAHSCGISDEEIAAFREIMLESGGVK